MCFFLKDTNDEIDGTFFMPGTKSRNLELLKSSISINDGKNLGELLCRDFLYWDTGILQGLRSNHSEKGT